MTSPNEFWLSLHQLADSLYAEGLTSEERSKNIVQQFEALAPIARREVLLDLTYLSLHLADLRVIITARANEMERSPAPQRMERAG